MRLIGASVTAQFVKGEIQSADLLNFVLKDEKIDTIMHFAAQVRLLASLILKYTYSSAVAFNLWQPSTTASDKVNMPSSVQWPAGIVPDLFPSNFCLMPAHLYQTCCFCPKAGMPSKLAHSKQASIAPQLQHCSSTRATVASSSCHQQWTV